jgi:hypothetical protein
LAERGAGPECSSSKEEAISSERIVNGQEVNAATEPQTAETQIPTEAHAAEAEPVGQLIVLHDPAKKRASRRKGATEERAMVRYLQARGFSAEKSSRAGYRGPDLTVPLLGIERVVEVKCRANGFRELYAWLADRDILIVRANRREPLVVLPMWLASEIAAEAERVVCMGDKRPRAHTSTNDRELSDA